MGADDHHTLGVFKPVGHVVVSFPSAEQALAARKALAAAGVDGGTGLHYYTDQQMLEQIKHDLANASPVAAIGQEVNLIKAHKALAERGYHWLVVPASRDELAQQVADICREHGAERAQSYGRFIIEELIVRDSDEQQYADTPDRGLDAGTPSGNEAERTRLRPGGDEQSRR